MQQNLLSRRDFLIGVGTLAVTLAGCGGTGGGSTVSTSTTVLNRAIQEFGPSEVEVDGDYVLRVGGHYPRTQNEGLIFKVNGTFPPDGGDLRSAAQYEIRDTDVVSWHVVQRDPSRSS